MEENKERTIEITQRAYMAIVHKANMYDLLKEYHKNDKHISDWEKVIYDIHDEAEEE